MATNNKVNDQQPSSQQQGAFPAGLEYLAQVDQLIAAQQVELLEVITGFETNNKYVISNSLGQQAFFAAEQTSCLARQCCGGGRPFELFVFDNLQQEVIHVSRPYRCGCCWGPASCYHYVTVSSPSTGAVLGTIRQTFSLWKPAMAIHDANGQQILKITGRCCPCGCGDVPFIIWSNEGDEVGRITKQFRGCIAECCTRADTFNITFPMDLDVNAKATLIGAMFLIDFMFFEENNN